MENTTFEIVHFRLHSFSNIRIEIFEHVEDKKNSFARAHNFKFRDVYPYGLNTLNNNVNIKKIDNMCDLVNRFNI